MGLFPSIDRSCEKQNDLNEIITGSLFTSIEYKISDIVKKIKNIDNLDINEIKQIIIRQHDMILNYDLFLMSTDTRRDAQTLFTNEKFLKCFLDVIKLIKLSRHEKTCINKLAYDYYINPNGCDRVISDLLFKLTSEVNGNEVVVLSALLGLNDAQILSMIRNSTFDMEKAVHRVNTFLIKSNNPISVGIVSKIYCTLFERFTQVFLYTMTEPLLQPLTEEQKHRYDIISVTLLEMMNSLTTADINKVLNDYAVFITMVRPDYKARFALRTATRYKRIVDAVVSIEIQNDIYIP